MSPLLARHSNAIYLNRALYARIADLYARRDSARPHRRAGARARPLSHPLRARRRRARQAGAGPAGGDQRAAGEPRHPVRPERAGGREGLRADAGGGRSRRPARLRPRRRARSGRGARRSRANTPSRWRARPAKTFLQFSARRDLREKVFQAWIKRGENGGATDNRALIAEMVALARRARQAPRLCDFRRLPARRPDGEDAGGRAQAARRGLGRARARRRRSSATRCRT